MHPRARSLVSADGRGSMSLAGLAHFSRPRTRVTWRRAPPNTRRTRWSSSSPCLWRRRRATRAFPGAEQRRHRPRGRRELEPAVHRWAGTSITWTRTATCWSTVGTTPPANWFYQRVWQVTLPSAEPEAMVTRHAPTDRARAFGGGDQGPLPADGRVEDQPVLDDCASNMLARRLFARRASSSRCRSCCSSSGAATTGAPEDDEARQATIWNRTQMHSGIRGATEVLQQEVGQAGRDRPAGRSVDAHDRRPITAHDAAAQHRWRRHVVGCRHVRRRELVFDGGAHEETVTLTAVNTATNR